MDATDSESRVTARNNNTSWPKGPRDIIVLVIRIIFFLSRRYGTVGEDISGGLESPISVAVPWLRTERQTEL